VIVIGSMISLGYYLPVIATMWMREAPAGEEQAPPRPGALPALAGGSPELDPASATVASPNAAEAQAQGALPEVALVALLAGAATIFFGLIPQPLFELVHGVGSALGLL